MAGLAVSADPRYFPAGSAAQSPGDNAGQDISLATPPGVPDGEAVWRDCTAVTFNPCGLPVLPFLKLACADMDGDGRTDLIAGGKDGRLTLFRSIDGIAWQADPDYFAGVGEGAFAAPTLGDLDGDGAAELIVGTGGFSSRSGQVLVYANTGTRTAPRWERWPDPVIDVGDDAAPAAVDYNLDGHCDLIVGNSTGHLTMLANDGRGRLAPEALPLALRRSFGMYATPGAIRLDRVVLLAVGSSVGKIAYFQLKRGTHGVAVQPFAITHPRRDFYAPLFVSLRQPDRLDLLLADGDGGVQYFEQKTPGVWAWTRNLQLFQNRLLPGPVCAPTRSRAGGRPRLVVGNMDGEVRAYEARTEAGNPSWHEWASYFLGVKVSGFARAVLTEWEGKEVVLVGQGNGDVAAWRNTGTAKTARWVAWPAFTAGVRVKGHSAPCLFDLDGDGREELIVGAADGRLAVYRSQSPRGGPPWGVASDCLGEIRVGGYAAPSFVRLADAVWLFVGQHDGRIRLFAAPAGGAAAVGFKETVMPDHVRVKGFASPWAEAGADGDVDLYVGDYDGNLRHFQRRLPSPEMRRPPDAHVE